jgi:hypothetical protein
MAPSMSVPSNEGRVVPDGGKTLVIKAQSHAAWTKLILNPVPGDPNPLKVLRVRLAATSTNPRMPTWTRSTPNGH